MATDNPSPSSSIDPVAPSTTSSPPHAKMVSFQNHGGEGHGYTPLSRDSTAINKIDVDETHQSDSLCVPFKCRNNLSRIVSRENGRPNVHHVGIGSSKWVYFLTDNFTTLVNAPWYVIFIVFIGTYVISWLLFGGVWTIVAGLERPPFNGSCLENVDGFSAALLFSIETQVTIGYGNTYIMNDCYAGLFVLVLQCVVGLIIDAVLLGLLFTKITRPRNRRRTILFADKMVLYEDRGERYLEFRIGNLRKSQIAECHIRLVLYWYREPIEEGGDGVLEQHDLQCGYETGTDRVVLLTPAVVRHKIDDTSPLRTLSLEGVTVEDLEIVVVLEGVVEATGLTLQALWSYTNEEMVVGEKLCSIVSRRGGRWEVDFSRFNEIITA